MKMLLTALLGMLTIAGYAQAEMEAWGNLRGIRVEGELMAPASVLRIVFADGRSIGTGQERQHPRFRREGVQQVVETQLDSLYITETVADEGRGAAWLTLSWTAHADMALKGAWLDLYGSTSFILKPDGEVEMDTVADTGGKRRFKLSLVKGHVIAGQSGTLRVLISTGGKIDRSPVQLVLDVTKPGRAFDGLGGNFRIQNPALDPQVIAYCLDSLRVAWGRVEMPWRFWQSAIDGRPLDSARAGNLHPAVRRAAEMARALGARKIPVIVSAWFPPDWAVVGPVRFRPGPDHVWGNALDATKTEAIYRSIADYIQLLKDNYGVEARFFSFNESDLGINVRQTAEEHRDLIKGLGAYFLSRGLATRVLLGDNSDATTYAFIDAAMNDAIARSYMGAISFHSWRGWDSVTLSKWADAATRLRLPLLVGEGSIDAAAWNYPAIFLEPSYALREIDLYIRLLRICQPASILQWQLTTDYSPLAGGGIFGDKGPLRPTQRFWNLRQLSMTPAGLYAMPVTSDRVVVTAAALGDVSKGVYVVHMVNNGAAREVILRGLPSEVKTMRIYTTNQTVGVKEGMVITVRKGEARFRVDAMSYVTVKAGV